MNKLTYLQLSDIFEDDFEDVRDLLGDLDIHIDGEALVLFSHEQLLRILKESIDGLEGEEDELLQNTFNTLDSFNMDKAEYINVGY